MNTVSSSRQS